MTFQEFSLEPGVPQWSIPAASPPLRCHSIPSQQPIGIQIAHFARTTLKSGGFISRPRLTPARIRLPPVFEITSPDLASPHLLSSNPLPNRLPYICFVGRKLSRFFAILSLPCVCSVGRKLSRFFAFLRVSLAHALWEENLVDSLPLTVSLIYVMCK